MINSIVKVISTLIKNERYGNFITSLQNYKKVGIELSTPTFNQIKLEFNYSIFYPYRTNIVKTSF